MNNNSPGAIHISDPYEELVQLIKKIIEANLTFEQGDWVIYKILFYNKKLILTSLVSKPQLYLYTHYMLSAK
jgi:hypothetical protein